MDEQVLNEAMESLSLIKGVINRTSKSFAAFSKIFIYWGILFLLNSILQTVMVAYKEILLDISGGYPIINYIFHVFPIGGIALLAIIIYRQVSKNLPLIGLEKHLMIVWILTLIMNIIPPKIKIGSTIGIDIQSVTIHYSNLSTMVFSLAIALIITSLFTGYKQPKYVGVIYICISLLYAYLPPIFNNTIIQFLYFLSLPFTFLYLGIFLKNQQSGRY